MPHWLRCSLSPCYGAMQICTPHAAKRSMQCRRIHRGRTPAGAPVGTASTCLLLQPFVGFSSLPAPGQPASPLTSVWGSGAMATTFGFQAAPEEAGGSSPAFSRPLGLQKQAERETPCALIPPTAHPPCRMCTSYEIVPLWGTVPPMLPLGWWSSAPYLSLCLTDADSLALYYHSPYSCNGSHCTQWACSHEEGLQQLVLLNHK